MVTHNPDLVSYATRIFAMDRGITDVGVHPAFWQRNGGSELPFRASRKDAHETKDGLPYVRCGQPEE